MLDQMLGRSSILLKLNFKFMSKKNFNVTFTSSAPGRQKGVFYLSVYRIGDTSGRKVVRIDGLNDPSPDHWDKKTQRFVQATETAIANNKVLEELEQKCEELQARPDINTPAQFIAAVYASEEKPKTKVLTFGGFIEEVVNKQRKEPTGNYQLMLTLLNNLKGENHRSTKGKVKHFPKPELNGVPLIDTPLAEIGTAHFAAFADWVKEVKEGKNYRGLTNTFHHALKIAEEEGKNSQPIKFQHRKHAPKCVTVSTQADKALTQRQFDEIKALGGTIVNPDGHRNRSQQALYLDTALLQYYTLSRPADVLLFRWDMVEERPDGTKVLRYIPFKKRTYTNATAHTTNMPLCPEALAIMEKYKGQSAGGYILPFDMNATAWDITDKRSYDKWKLAETDTLGKVNAHLKKVGERVALPFELDLYAFRRSAITHELNKGTNIAQVARRAGTSVNMISKHYYKDNEF